MLVVKNGSLSSNVCRITPSTITRVFLTNELSLMVYGPGARRQCCCWRAEHSAGSSKVDAVSLFEDKDLKVLCGKAHSLCCWLKQINDLICMMLSFPRCFVLTLNYTWIRLLFFQPNKMPLLAQIRYNNGLKKQNKKKTLFVSFLGREDNRLINHEGLSRCCLGNCRKWLHDWLVKLVLEMYFQVFARISSWLLKKCESLNTCQKLFEISLWCLLSSCWFTTSAQKKILRLLLLFFALLLSCSTLTGLCFLTKLDSRNLQWHRT